MSEYFACRLLTKDEELAAWRSMRRGDVRSRQALLESIVPWIIRLATRHARGLGRERLDELISLGNLHMAKVIDKFRPRRGRLTTYTSVCLHRLFMREKRFWLRDRERAQDIAFHRRLPHPADLAEEVCAEEERRRRAADVDAALQKLSVRERSVVERRMAGDTLKAIGAEFGVCKERVRQLETKARIQLRKALVKYQPEERQ